MLGGVVLLVTGCGGGPTGPEAAVDGPPADLSFTAETLDGKAFDGESLAGRPAVLWFWAPWCPTCRAQAGGVGRLAQEYAGEVAVVGVGGLAEEQSIADVAARIDGPTHLVDPAGEVWQHFGVDEQSSYLVIDEDGRVVSTGYLDDPVLADLVATLSAGTSPDTS